MKPSDIAKSILSAIGIIALVLFVASSLSSCTFASGNGSKWTVASLGSDITMMDITGAGFKADKIDNSTAFKEATKQIRNMWQSYLALQGLEFIGGKYYDKAGQEISSTQTVKLQELQNAKDIKTAELKLEELKLFPPE
jgi:hypothetical protein